LGKIQEIPVPDIGDFDEVEVVEVLVSKGDQVAIDDSLITLESDKASMEIPAPVAGVVQELKVAPGAKIGTGAIILTLEIGEGADAPEETAEGAPREQTAAPPAKETEKKTEIEKPSKAGSSEPESSKAESSSKGKQESPAPGASADLGEIDEKGFAAAHASPAVRRFARELGVDLGKVEGGGRKGRILKEDVQGFVKKALSGGAPGASGAFALPSMPSVDFSRFGEIEEKPLSRIRKIAAKHLSRAWVTVPHVTQFDEADITEMEAFRKAQKAAAAAKDVKLTPVAFLLKACARALREFPDFNSSLAPDGESLILKQYVHIGIAVDTPIGLVVPVIRDVDQKGLFELAAELGEVSGRARDGKLPPKDLSGGCFSISSLGGIGGVGFTPIVNAPEVAILGVARSSMKPVFQDGAFVPRLMLPFSLSYDHRVIDGAAGVRFTTYLASLLSDIRQLLL